MPYRVQARIRERCGDRPVYRGDQAIGFTLPDKCALGLSTADASVAARRVRAVPEIAADLTRYLSALDQKLLILEESAKQTDELAEALEAE
jgi:hypothetical protein